MQKLKTHLKDPSTLATIGILLLISLMTVIPMMKTNAIAYLTVDGRWWVNQYYEFCQSMYGRSPVALSAFNQSGLAINTFYPALGVRWAEFPFALMQVQNIYIAFGALNIIATLLYIWAFFLIAKHLKHRNPLLSASVATLIQTTLLNVGFSNSYAQYFANAFLFFGVYALMCHKYRLMGLTTFAILTTSFATALIAIPIYLIIMLSLKPRPNWREWRRQGLAGALAVLFALPYIKMPLTHVKDVMPPTDKFMPSLNDLFFVQYFQTQGVAVGIAMTIRVLIPLIVLVAAFWQYRQTKTKRWLLIAASYTLISISPYISGLLTTPIQSGTWFRTWPLVAVIFLFVIGRLPLKHQWMTAGLIVATSGFAYLINTSPYALSDLQPNPLTKALKTDNLKEVADTMASGVELKTKSNQTILSGSSQHITEMSPDYVPIGATNKDRQLAYLPKNKLKEQYGLTKWTVDKETNKIQIKINPKQPVTPLAIWHYDFFKYQIQTTAGEVRATNHQTFEYVGSSPSKITIKVSR